MTKMKEKVMAEVLAHKENAQLSKAQRSFLYGGLMSYAVLGFVTAQASAVANPIDGADSFEALIELVINFALSFLGVVAVLYFIYMGFKYVTAGGDGKQAGEAKEGITHAIIGVIVALIGYLAVQYIFSTLGANEQVTKNFDS